MSSIATTPLGLASAICVGAMFGSLGRFALQNFTQNWKVILFGHQLPVGLFLINGIGSFLIGVCAVVLYHRADLPRELVIGVTVGLLGSFTTFSTFSLESYSIFVDRGMISFFLYLLLHVGGCILLTVLGMSLARSVI